MRNLAQPDIDKKALDGSSEIVHGEVIHWNEGKHVTEGISSVAIDTSPARKSSKRVPKSVDALPRTAPTENGKKQPFCMFYDGISAAEYAASRFKLGAR